MSDDVVFRRMPKARKVTLMICLSLAFVNTVIIIVAVVRPVPQYSSSGHFMYIQAVQNWTLDGNRAYSVRERSLDDTEWRYQEWLLGRPKWLDGQLSLSDPPFVKSSYRINSVSSARPAEFQDSREKVVKPVYGISSVHIQPRSPCSDCLKAEPKTKKNEPTSTYYLTRAPPGQRHTRLTTSIHHLTETIDGQVTHTRKPSKPSSTGKSGIQPFPINATASVYVEIFLGLLGGCMSRSNGTTVCNSATASPDYTTLYKQAGLSSDVQGHLPKGPGAMSVLLLAGASFHVLSMGGFAITLSPPFALMSSWGPRKSMDSRHQVTMGVTTVLTALALFALIISIIVLRSLFIKSTKSMPAYEDYLRAELGGAFSQLYIACIFGAGVFLLSLATSIGDLRYPWWQMYDNPRRNPYETTPKAINITPEYLRTKESQDAMLSDFERRRQTYLRQKEFEEEQEVAEAQANMNAGIGGWAAMPGPFLGHAGSHLGPYYGGVSMPNNTGI